MGQAAAICLSTPQYKHLPSAILLARSSGVILLRLADRSIGPGAVPTAVVLLFVAVEAGVLAVVVLRVVVVEAFPVLA